MGDRKKFVYTRSDAVVLSFLRETTPVLLLTIYSSPWMLPSTEIPGNLVSIQISARFIVKQQDILLGNSYIICTVNQKFSSS